MKIALCSTYVPFIKGGLRNIVEWLADELKSRGHAVEIIYIPWVDRPDLFIEQYQAVRAIDLRGQADLAICFRPPAYAIRHDNKVVWFIHHFREYYDLWNGPYSAREQNFERCALRETIHRLDSEALGEAKAIYTNSQIVQERLKFFNNLESKVLYPPIKNPERFHFQEIGNSIAYVCRVEHHKRQHLLIEAMAHCRTPVKLIIGGKTGNVSYESHLKNLISKYQLENRVSFNNEWITEAEKITVLSQCLAAAYLPLDEDSYGYPTLEAAHSLKALISTTDSGGVLEFVKDNHNGFICEPNPKSLAAAIDTLYANKPLAKRMGENAFAQIKEVRIDWQNVCSALIAQTGPC